MKHFGGMRGKFVHVFFSFCKIAILYDNNDLLWSAFMTCMHNFDFRKKNLGNKMRQMGIKTKANLSQ